MNELMYLPILHFEIHPDLNLLWSKKYHEKFFALELENGHINSFVKSFFQSDADFLRMTGRLRFLECFRSNICDHARGFVFGTRLKENLSFYNSGPRPWLGLLDLAGNQESLKIICISKSRNGIALFNGQAPQNIIESNEKGSMDPYGNIFLSSRVPLAIRYQIARFCDWKTGKDDNEYIYRITSDSLENASKQGLKASQFISLLQKALVHPIPR